MSYSEHNSLPYKFDLMCKTDILESDKYTFVWRISKFSLRTEKNGEVMVSDDFTIKGPHEKITKWKVELYPKGKREDARGYVSVFLHNNSAEDVVANYVVSTLDAKENKQKIFENVMKFRKFGYNGKDGLNGWGSNKAIAIRELAQHTPDDILTLFFEVTVLGEESTNSSENSAEIAALTPNYHQKQLVLDLDSALVSKNHCDVIIKCGEKEFDCHQIILTSRSPVLATMLRIKQESSRKEKGKVCVEIKDMNLAVFEDLLKYIYTGNSPNVDSHVEELFAAADRYELEQLKELCEVKLCSRLAISNCIDLLILADLHRGQTLRAAALQYVSKNIHKIKACDWQESLIANPTLMAEVMVQVLPDSAVNNISAAVEREIDQLADHLLESTKSTVTSYFKSNFSAVSDYASSFTVAQVALKAVDSSLEIVDGVLNTSISNVDEHAKALSIKSE